ncbi:hypothetical protein SAMN05192575_106207 [Nocardioides alpinus]|uniref:PKD domain-containing protein n=1 Tax=Nocardioides alpinus TaxID=748909 RepID=A0A1I0ZUG6_9ACTN|nr:hypothetical protein [Nocardioides alpinus]PKH41821.1 hypothetical protein CXG46_08120 [Nocardioides alpinus]SFB28726.1 hypothetical protein SAMN05192575_106207 [Nocardioides alpinus]
MSTKVQSWRRPAVPVLISVLTVLLLVPGAASAAPPVAESGPDVTVVAGTDAQLSGSVSDPDGDALEIRWLVTVVSEGDVSSCTFSGPWSWAPVTAQGLSPSLSCTQPGSYLLQLVVGDGTSSDDDTGALITFTDPDTSPATCTFRPWIKRLTSLRIGDAQSGLASYTVLHTYNIAVAPMSGTWSPPTSSQTLQWLRTRRGPGLALISHTNGAGRSGECVLFVRRDGTARVVG